jgi:signal transduction histidine kinase/CheY-like chemotaxis protein
MLQGVTMAVKSGYMRFRHQILLLLLSIILIMMVAAVLVAVPAAFTAQQRITFDRLNSVSNLKTLWVMREFNELKRGLVALSDNVAVVDEVRFINKVLPRPGGDQQLIKRLRKLDQRADLLAGDRLSLYWQSYRRLYANFRYIENSFPGSEVLLVRPGDGLVIFNLLGGERFMDRLNGASHSRLPLYKCYQRALASPEDVVFEDYNAGSTDSVQRACAAKALMVDEEVVAVLIQEFSGDLINNIMSLRPGLGETGETYLVGPDKLMRTESRFGGAASIMAQFVDSRAVREGLSGFAGSSITTNYRGAQVFSVWQPIELDAIHWSLISEIEEDESYRGMRTTISQLLLVWWVGFLVLVFVAYAFARRTEKPLLALVRNARRLAEGNFSGSIREGAGSREIRDLVRSFNNMGAQIRERTGALESARNRAEQASWQADQASRAKSDFLSKMSHELRTPLNGVLGYAQILKRDRNISENQRDTLDAIENCGQHLLELINDVLDIARIESGKLDLNIRPANMHQLVQRVVDVVKPRALEKGLEFEVDTSSLPYAIYTDAMRLRQILINLLGNAIKFTDEGHVRLRVENDTEASVLTIYIEDSGAGIPEHRLDEIFGPFAQTISGKRAGGAGLGLAISKQLSIALGGELKAASKPGQGSVFSINLPYMLADDQMSTQTVPVVDVPSLPGGASFRVLVADDNATNRDIMVQLLRDAGFDTFQADDGEEVLEIVHTQPLDLILMDIRMPVIDGLTATRTIRDSGKYPEMKIIAVSATVLPEMQDEIIRCGCDAFLGKPVDARILFGEIEKQLGIEMTTVTAGNDDDAEAATQEKGGDIAAEDRAGVIELLLQIDSAAGFGDIAAVRERINRLQEMLGTEYPLLLQLQRMSDSFEMQAIARLVQQSVEKIQESKA